MVSHCWQPVVVARPGLTHCPAERVPVLPCTGLTAHCDSALLFPGERGPSQPSLPCPCRAAYSHMRRRSRDTRAESLLPDVSGPSASGGSLGVLDVARSLSAGLQVRTQRGTDCVASQGCRP